MSLAPGRGLVDANWVRVLGSIWVWGWVGIFGVLCQVLGLVLLVPFNRWTDPKRKAMDIVNQLWARGILFILPRIRVEYEGLHRLSGTKEAFIVCANHTSVADIIVLLGGYAHLKFVAKKKLFSVPLLSSQMRFAGYVQQPDEGEADTVLPAAKRWHELGVHVLFFPEGSRSPDGQVKRFHRGPFFLAQRLGARVLPVAIAGNFQVLSKRNGWKYSFCLRVKVSVLEPVDAAGEPKDVARLARERIRAALGPPSPGR